MSAHEISHDLHASKNNSNTEPFTFENFVTNQYGSHNSYRPVTAASPHRFQGSLDDISSVDPENGDDYIRKNDSDIGNHSSEKNREHQHQNQNQSIHISFTEKSKDHSMKSHSSSDSKFENKSNNHLFSEKSQDDQSKISDHHLAVEDHHSYEFEAELREIMNKNNLGDNSPHSPPKSKENTSNAHLLPPVPLSPPSTLSLDVLDYSMHKSSRIGPTVAQNGDGTHKPFSGLPEETDSRGILTYSIDLMFFKYSLTYSSILIGAFHAHFPLFFFFF